MSWSCQSIPIMSRPSRRTISARENARSRGRRIHRESQPASTSWDGLSVARGSGCMCAQTRGGRCVGASSGFCAARDAARCGTAYIASVSLTRTPHQAERLITLRVFYKSERNTHEEKCRDIAACDLLQRSFVRCHAWFRGVDYERRFELVREAIVRYLGDDREVGDVVVDVARNPNCKFLVVGIDSSLRMKPLIPYLIAWRDGDMEAVMDGELLERLDIEAGLPPPREGTLALRSRGPLPATPRVAFELFAGEGEIAVKIANTFPSLECVYAFEIDGNVVSNEARRHPRVVVVECDLRALRYLRVPKACFVWCSPPCTKYSAQKRSQYKRMGDEFKKHSLDDADTYVATCLDFIRATRANCWVIENPLGELRNRAHIWSTIEHVRCTTSYCKYGRRYRKWTDLFMSEKLGRILHENGGIEPKCSNVASPCRHVRSGRHPERATGRSARELARVPMALVSRILRAGAVPALRIEHGSI